MIEKTEAEIKEAATASLNKRAAAMRDAELTKSPVSTSIDWRDIPDADSNDPNDPNRKIKGKTHWQKLAEKELKL